MIQSEQMQDRGMEVMHITDVLNRFVAKLVCRTIAEWSFDTGASHPAGKAFGIMVAPAGIFLECGHATEFGAPHDQRIFQQSPLFQIRDQRGCRLIEHRAMHAVLIFQYFMTIPVAGSFTTRLIRTVKELYEPHALLQQSPSENAVFRISGLQRVLSVVSSVQREC